MGHDGPDAGTGSTPIGRWIPNIVNDPTYSGTIKNDLKAVPTVSLVMPWNNWFGGGGEGIYIAGSNLERQGSMEFFTADGSEEFQIDGALEIWAARATTAGRMTSCRFAARSRRRSGRASWTRRLLRTRAPRLSSTHLIFDAVFNWSWAYGGTSDLPYQRTQAKYIQDQFVADLQQKMGGARAARPIRAALHQRAVLGHVLPARTARLQLCRGVSGRRQGRLRRHQAQLERR